MIKNYKFHLNLTFISILILLSFILTIKKSFSQNKPHLRVAIVYNDSESGKRYRDGIRSQLESVAGDILLIKDIPYIKSNQG